MQVFAPSLRQWGLFAGELVDKRVTPGPSATRRSWRVEEPTPEEPPRTSTEVIFGAGEGWPSMGVAVPLAFVESSRWGG